MKKLLVLGTALLGLSACTPTQQGASIGAATGATVGALTTGTLGGAVVGGVIGGAAGTLLGRVAGESNMCWYRDARGRSFRDICPRG